ncbi:MULTISPECIES: potassium-transporting ATPase subunit KdpA [Photorhabdus]|uniref:Potassium-transporting ATPase potassium-binding subunit n=2 Tax=Photorhabdus asymbiotica TaxID=291112 RepID=B6VN58_PHOAA|nr:potassium-transporting ATPase subunit KdpA [Photorhabdus asymbiotica]RKS56550.1 K+-transporting ATPase ATPase A chain [Photorhabdus asymbiotica]CAQ85074.1 potassium-transporting ATPase A chain [Photorhabdus asymbiotica]CAR67588.1 potassium-transporting atpase a chain (ec 3.6.3.12) (potassium translocating atpase a chain) (atp phosphohydrolase [potassium transporting] a chain) (potassium-binding and translocating subuni a) [Photorhabdus asymbiotica subsp. asymbiotica ATCC 43949]
MAASAFLLITSFLLILMVLAKPLGNIIANMIEGDIPHWLTKTESGLWRCCGLQKPGGAVKEMNWWQYALAIIIFNLTGLLLLFILLITQGGLPLNPQHFPGLKWDLALNTAVSFITNTDWQAYSGENTLSYLSQMTGLTVQNFLSAATGIAVAFALIRAFSRHGVETVGNAWVDITRITLYLLLPLSMIIALVFVSQGVIQNFEPYQLIHTIEDQQQFIPMGPVASQEAIKLLGTNGGGFFAANSSHPFENPTAISNFIQILSILLIPSALCFAFGQVIGDNRQGHALLWAMCIIFVVATVVVMYAELKGNPHLSLLGADSNINMEGKESRFGILATSIYAVVTTAASCGAVNAMHDSFTALGGMIPMWLIQIGEVVFGGVGSGLYGMLLFVLLTVFIAGLMIGRAPEYLGKKIEVFEMKMVALAILVTPTLVLLGTALVISTENGRAGILNPGAHGFSEVLYALSSAANNNGSAFSGLSTNNMFYNLLLATVIFLGRFGVILPVLAIAGSLVTKKRQPASNGTLPTYSPLFIGLLILTIMLIGALTFIPALILGPVIEHLQIWLMAR